MQPLIEHRPTFAGVATRALELEGERPAVLLLHGYADSADCWRLLLDRFARSGQRAMAIDLPGFGVADPLKRDRLLLEQFDDVAADAVHHLAEETGGPVYVVGNSMGGVVALRLAERDDLPLAGVMPIGPAGFDHPSWFQLILSQPGIRLALQSPVAMPPAVIRPGVAAAYRRLAFAKPVPDEAIAAFVDHNASQRDLRRLLAIGRRLVPEIADGVAFHLEDIRVPVTLVWGDRDRMVSHRGARHLLAAQPHTHYKLLTGSGHCPQVEDPGLIHDLVVEAVRLATLTAA